jgi:hypothetical protein
LGNSGQRFCVYPVVAAWNMWILMSCFCTRLSMEPWRCNHILQKDEHSVTMMIMEPIIFCWWKESSRKRSTCVRQQSVDKRGMLPMSKTPPWTQKS